MVRRGRRPIIDEAQSHMGHECRGEHGKSGVGLARTGAEDEAPNGICPWEWPKLLPIRCAFSLRYAILCFQHLTVTSFERSAPRGSEASVHASWTAAEEICWCCNEAEKRDLMANSDMSVFDDKVSCSTASEWSSSICFKHPVFCSSRCLRKFHVFDPFA